MKKASTTPSSYRIGWIASLFAVHCDYDSFFVVDDGILLVNGRTRKSVSYLAIGPGIAVEPGYFWDVLAVHLENGKIIRVGGISKKQSRRLQAVLDNASRLYLAEFYQRLALEIKTAFQQAQVLFSGNRYIRQAVVRQWLKANEILAKGIQRKDMHRFLPTDAAHGCKLSGHC